MQIAYPYREIIQRTSLLPSQFDLLDHLGGFRPDASNQLFDVLSMQSRSFDITWHQIIESTVQARYPSLNITFSPELQQRMNLQHFQEYRQHPENRLQHFLCSFNGSAHVSRKLLVAILNRTGCFDPAVCTKNFVMTHDEVDGHVSELVSDHDEIVAQKLFQDKDAFFGERFDIGSRAMAHNVNIRVLEQPLTQSWVNVVSETMATSFQPFVTEKFLYSIVTRGLFVAYAQPGWHRQIRDGYGFRLYDRVFDYGFDAITNPVLRLIRLMEMLLKFRQLSVSDWHDLRELESDAIEFNIDHYHSGGYMQSLKQYDPDHWHGAVYV